MAESRVTVSDLKEQLTPSIERTARVTSRSVTSKLSAELRASGILEDGYRGTRGFEERLSQIVEEAVMVAVEIVLCEFETVVDRSLKELQTTVAEYHKEIERLRQKTEAHRGPKKSMRGHTSCGDSRPGAMGTAGGSIGQDSSSKKELNPKESAVVEKGRCLVVALPRLETLISRQEESSGSPGEIHSEKLKADVSKCHLKMEDCLTVEEKKRKEKLQCAESLGKVNLWGAHSQVITLNQKQLRPGDLDQLAAYPVQDILKNKSVIGLLI
ncbi:uncharacterized protein LOC114663007 isoform X2 [Erpetoichthys calabaricus]|uniref:uncharacterized protein LOC114663007 isoform X2 n=1 Tax=Erpetoichthys calabaricus TaxID=27687 RepID=UPI00109F0830|nr:uncharacterized protein LOC114663007 isoform X2 [Erpetoichthys calabaricus]